MRNIILTSAVLCFAVTSGSADPGTQVQSLDNPAYSEPSERWESLEDALPDGEIPPIRGVTLDEITQADCRDRIEEAREVSGQTPLLQREAASPSDPQMIYAVDRRQEGCSVMVMMGSHEDIRPLPKRMDEPAQVIPADADQ